MKTGKIESSGRPSEQELSLINKFTRREFSAEDIYSFSVILCDNDVDRDSERFTVSALHKMAELFLGKTGIFDHSQKSSDQCARVYFCKVCTDSNKKTVTGDDYTYLLAKAYMPITEKNRELITEIDAGIKKEVSVGCSVRSRKCSVCGGNPAVCGHKKGRYYQRNGAKTLCFHELDDPSDAYEWSFVAVPAQRRAGVTKQFEVVKDRDILEIVKGLEEGGVTLDPRTASVLADHIRALEVKTAAAEEYLSLQKQRVIGRMAASMTDGQAKVFKSAVDRMTAHELFSLMGSVEEGNQTPAPKLRRERSKKNSNQNKEFII